MYVCMYVCTYVCPNLLKILGRRLRTSGVELFIGQKSGFLLITRADLTTKVQIEWYEYKCKYTS